MGGISFSYGSNLCDKQMRERCPSARRVLRALLPDHRLVFAGYSNGWGGGVASVVRQRGCDVAGVLWRLSNEDLWRLDRFEGVPRVYERVQRIVVDEDGKRRRAFVYVMPEEGILVRKPSRAYVAIIKRAYTKFGFDKTQLQWAAGAQQ